MRWRFNGTLRVAAGKSLTACSIQRAGCAASADAGLLLFPAATFLWAAIMSKTT
jgi:hypothetical protein